MLFRRIAYLLITIVSVAGLAWAVGNLRFSVGEAESQEPAAAQSRFAAPIAEPPPADSRVDYARIDERLRLLMDNPSMVGLAVAIVEDGEIRFVKGYGVTASDGEEPVTPETVFRWASLSKGVAADMVAMLAEEGRLSLTDPIIRYSASLRLPGGREAQATVTDLLSHRLGIHAHANDPKLEDGQDPSYLRGDLAMLSSICSVGQCHAYQNVAYDAASEVVERVTGQPFREVVRERLFQPLGMQSASITREGLVTAPSWARAHSGGRNSRPVEVTDHYYRVPAAGGVNSNIVDLARWMRAQMGLAPDVLSHRVLNTVQAAQVTTPGESARRRRYRDRILASSYGLGWRVYNYAGHRVIGHRGGVRGYRSLIMFDPQLRTGVVALWNSNTAQPGGLEFEVMDMLYGLPAQDWLRVDESRPAAAPAETDETMNQGAG